MSSPRADSQARVTSTDAGLPAPRYATLWAVLVYFAAAMTLAFPALAGEFLINPRSDQYIAGYAFREFAAAMLRAGEGFPQWNPYLFGGMPYIAAMHGDIFYPTFLLRMMLPTDVAMTWTFIIHLFLAGLFTFAFLRAWGDGPRPGADRNTEGAGIRIGFHAALLGGLAYMMSGPIAGFASPGHDGKLFVSSLLPLALWMLVRGVRDGRSWAWGVFAIAVGLAVLSPHPQLLQYMLLVCGAFALFLAFSEHEGGLKLSRKVAVQRLGIALGCVVLGGLMGAVQYLPLREYVDWSPRAGGAGWDHAVSYSMPPEELLNSVVPEFSGILDRYWGRNGIHFHSDYAGVAVLVLAGAGVFAAGVRRRARWFWIGTLIVSLLWALGGYTVFYRLIYEIVPGTKFFRAPSTMMFVSMFALAVLSAFGTERVLRSALGLRFFIWPGALALIALLIATGLPVAMADAIGEAMAAVYQNFNASQVGVAARANQSAAALGAIRSIAVVLAVSGVVFAASRRALTSQVVAILLAALVTIDLWSVERHYWIFSSRAQELFRSDPAIDFVRAQPEPGRVLQWAPPGTTAAPRDRAFSGDLMMIHGVRSAIGYHGNQLGRYDELLRQSTTRLFQGDRPEFWRHENVRYLYTTVSDTLIGLVSAQLRTGPFEKVVGPVQNFVGSTVYLYRVPGENPAAWVASAIVKAGDDQSLATILDSRFDHTRAAIFDTSANVAAPALTTVPEPSGIKASVTRFEPGGIDVHLDKPAPEGAALVVSENYFPGWRATVDGREAVVSRANFNLIGVVLPRASREVQLRFVDSAYQTGKLVTWIAIALAAALLGVGVVADRRRAATSA